MDKSAFAPFVSIDASSRFKFYRRAVTFHTAIGMVYVKIKAVVQKAPIGSTGTFKQQAARSFGQPIYVGQSESFN